MAAIEHRQRCPGWQRRLRGELVEPAQVQRREHDGLKTALRRIGGLRQNDYRKFGDTADLVVADGKPARLHGALEIRTVGNLESALERHTTADHLAIGPDDADVCQACILRHQA